MINRLTFLCSLSFKVVLLPQAKSFASDNIVYLAILFAYPTDIRYRQTLDDNYSPLGYYIRFYGKKYYNKGGLN